MLKENFASADVFSDVRDIVREFESGSDVPDLVHLLHRAAVRLGADAAFYVSVVRDAEVVSSIRSLFACDPLWGLIYEQLLLSDEDPWLRYASRHSAPASGSVIVARADEAGKAQELAREHGFRSSFIVPIHAGGASPTRRIARFGILVLGSDSVGFFERGQTTTLRMLARSLALELHEAYGRLLRRERIDSCALTVRELDLLDRDRLGQSTKAIARALDTSPLAIDQLFWRIGKKLGVKKRRACVRLAVEYCLM